MSHKPGYSRRSRMLALALALPVVAGGCSTLGAGKQAAVPSAAGPVAAASARSDNLMRIARSTEAAGDAATAAGLYQRAHQMDPAQPEPLIALAGALRGQGMNIEAAEAYRGALALDANNLPALHGLGLALIGAGQPSAALDIFDTALHIDSRDAKLWNARGVALDMLGQHGAAQTAYRTGIDIAPHDAGLRNNLGLSLALGGNSQDAIIVLEGIAESPEASARNRQNLALAYGLAGQSGRAGAIAQRDLPPEAVRSNLSYYNELRGRRADLSKLVAVEVARPMPPAMSLATVSVDRGAQMSEVRTAQAAARATAPTSSVRPAQAGAASTSIASALGMAPAAASPIRPRRMSTEDALKAAVPAMPIRPMPQPAVVNVPGVDVPVASVIVPAAELPPRPAPTQINLGRNAAAAPAPVSAGGWTLVGR